MNNATISVVGGLEETSISLSCEVFETNFFGALRVTYAVLPHMRLRGVGRILNISSVLGILPGPFLGICAASQFALEGWSATLDHELRSTGIRVSTIRTGLSKTDIDAVFSAGRMLAVETAEYLGIRPRYIDGTIVGGCSFIQHAQHAIAARLR